MNQFVSVNAKLISHLRETLTATSGSDVEVRIAWRDQYLQTYHYHQKATVHLGPSFQDEIFVPSLFVSKTKPFLRIAQNECEILIPAQVGIEVIGRGYRYAEAELRTRGRLKTYSEGRVLSLQQGEVLCLDFDFQRDIQVFVRFVPASAIPLIQSTVKIDQIATGFLGSMIASLVGLYIASLPKLSERAPRPEERIGIVQFEIPEPKIVVKSTDIFETPITEAIKPIEEKVVRTEREPPKDMTPVSEIPAKIPHPHVRKPNPNTKKSPGGLSTEDLAKLLNSAEVSQKMAGDVIGKGLGSDGAANSERGIGHNPLGLSRDSGTSGKSEGLADGAIGDSLKNGRQRGLGHIQGDAKSSVAIESGPGTGEVFTGSIDREAVRRVVRAALPQLKACYERGLIRNSQMSGKVVIRFQIEAQGRVRSSQIRTSTLNDAGFENCLTQVIRDQKFPDPPAGVLAEVDYPFVFDSQR